MFTKPANEDQPANSGTLREANCGDLKSQQLRDREDRGHTVCGDIHRGLGKGWSADRLQTDSVKSYPTWSADRLQTDSVKSYPTWRADRLQTDSVKSYPTWRADRLQTDSVKSYPTWSADRLQTDSVKSYPTWSADRLQTDSVKSYPTWRADRLQTDSVKCYPTWRADRLQNDSVKSYPTVPVLPPFTNNISSAVSCQPSMSTARTRRTSPPCHSTLHPYTHAWSNSARTSSSSSTTGGGGEDEADSRVKFFNPADDVFVPNPPGGNQDLPFRDPGQVPCSRCLSSGSGSDSGLPPISPGGPRCSGSSSVLLKRNSSSLQPVSEEEMLNIMEGTDLREVLSILPPCQCDACQLKEAAESLSLSSSSSSSSLSSLSAVSATTTTAAATAAVVSGPAAAATTAASVAAAVRSTTSTAPLPPSSPPPTQQPSRLRRVVHFLCQVFVLLPQAPHFTPQLLHFSVKLLAQQTHFTLQVVHLLVQ
ncbi:hypothetical protein ACOMHN_032990 [Nucella lapillus]